MNVIHNFTNLNTKILMLTNLNLAKINQSQEIVNIMKQTKKKYTIDISIENNSEET